MMSIHPDSLLAFINNEMHSPQTPKPVRELNRLLKDAFMGAIYDTDDNRSALKHLQIKRIKNENSTDLDVITRPSGFRVSRILWQLEDLDFIPEPVKEVYPELTQDEWRAALRFTVRLLSAVNRREMKRTQK